MIDLKDVCKRVGCEYKEYVGDFGSLQAFADGTSKAVTTKDAALYAEITFDGLLFAKAFIRVVPNQEITDEQRQKLEGKILTGIFISYLVDKKIL